MEAKKSGHTKYSRCWVVSLSFSVLNGGYSRLTASLPAGEESYLLFPIAKFPTFLNAFRNKMACAVKCPPLLIRYTICGNPVEG